LACVGCVGGLTLLSCGACTYTLLACCGCAPEVRLEHMEKYVYGKELWQVRCPFQLRRPRVSGSYWEAFCVCWTDRCQCRTLNDYAPDSSDPTAAVSEYVVGAQAYLDGEGIQADDPLRVFCEKFFGSERFLERVGGLFSQFDADDSGKLDKLELVELLASLSTALVSAMHGMDAQFAQTEEDHAKVKAAYLCVRPAPLREGGSLGGRAGPRVVRGGERSRRGRLAGASDVRVGMRR
jgi:hypothetical protein